jgi:hypothetical protein
MQHGDAAWRENVMLAWRALQASPRALAHDRGAHNEAGPRRKASSVRRWPYDASANRKSADSAIRFSDSAKHPLIPGPCRVTGNGEVLQPRLRA